MLALLRKTDRRIEDHRQYGVFRLECQEYIAFIASIVQPLYPPLKGAFSPVHNIGHGPAHTVAPADLAAIKKCDAVFAILDGLDSGTVFEVGYARALKKPVYALAQTVSEEDLKMIAGSKCSVFADFVTALHHLAWRS